MALMCICPSSYLLVFLLGYTKRFVRCPNHVPWPNRNCKLCACCIFIQMWLLFDIGSVNRRSHKNSPTRSSYNNSDRTITCKDVLLLSQEHKFNVLFLAHTHHVADNPNVPYCIPESFRKSFQKKRNSTKKSSEKIHSM